MVLFFEKQVQLAKMKWFTKELKSAVSAIPLTTPLDSSLFLHPEQIMLDVKISYIRQRGILP